MSKAQRVIAGIATLLLGAALAACSGGGAVATVNGEPISQADFAAKLEASPVARGILQQMVQEQLILQYAKQNNIALPTTRSPRRKTISKRTSRMARGTRCSRHVASTKRK